MPDLLTEDTAAVPLSPTGGQWGIFDSNGSPVIVGDSVVAVEYRKEFRISDAPQEPNSFVSYNKVEVPYDARVTFAKGGLLAERTSFLESVSAAVASLDLYKLVTPEIFYASANLVSFSYRRQSQNGVTLLVVEIGVRQVRLAGPAAFTNTKSPSGASPQPVGNVQPIDPGTSDQATGRTRITVRPQIQ